MTRDDSDLPEWDTPGTPVTPTYGPLTADNRMSSYNERIAELQPHICEKPCQPIKNPPETWCDELRAECDALREQVVDWKHGSDHEAERADELLAERNALRAAVKWNEEQRGIQAKEIERLLRLHDNTYRALRDERAKNDPPAPDNADTCQHKDCSG